MDKASATQGRRIRKIYINFASYSQNIYLLSSHRSHKSHRERIVTLAFAIRLKISSKLHSSGKLKFPSSQPTLIRVGGNADKRGRSDAPFVRFVRSV